MRKPMRGRATSAEAPCACWAAFRRPEVRAGRVAVPGPLEETICRCKTRSDADCPSYPRADSEKARQQRTGDSPSMAGDGMQDRAHTRRLSESHPRADI